MMVVDLGCYTHPQYPQDESTNRLIERFRPDFYYGFDPHPDQPIVSGFPAGETEAWTFQMAAWTYDGEVSYDPRPDRPLAAAVGSGPLTVPCFDLAYWLTINEAANHPIVMKMDVEGAEYTLLPHLIERDAVSGRFDLLLIEWHAPPIGPPTWEADRDRILELLNCEVEEW